MHIPKFTNNNREKKDYEKLSEFIKRNHPDSFFGDVNLYLAKIYNSFGKNIRKNYLRFSEAKIQNSDYGDILRDNLRILYEQYLSKTVLLESLRVCSNQQFTIIGNRIIKPLLLEKQDIQDMFLKTEEDSIAELLAKNMDWFSKSSKEIEMVSKSVLNEIPGNIEINGYTMRYINDYISSVCINGKIIRDHLLECGDDNIFQNSDDDVLTRINDMINITNDNFDTNITIQDVYKYASCKKLQEYLYTIKALTQIELYRQEAKNRKSGNNTGVIFDIKRDQSMNGTNFNTKFIVNIPFYINNFRDHSDISSLAPLINKQIMDGEDTKSFPLESSPEIPFRPFITFKLDDKRIYQIYRILENYDDPKINCFLTQENSDRLSKVYGYLADRLHYSIFFDDEKELENYPSQYLLSGDIEKFKASVRNDRNYLIEQKRDINQRIDFN